MHEHPPAALSPSGGGDLLKSLRLAPLCARALLMTVVVAEVSDGLMQSADWLHGCGTPMLCLTGLAQVWIVYYVFGSFLVTSVPLSVCCHCYRCALTQNAVNGVCKLCRMFPMAAHLYINIWSPHVIASTMKLQPPCNYQTVATGAESIIKCWPCCFCLIVCATRRHLTRHT